MARYRKIDVRMRSDEKFRALSAPPPNGQDCWIYLLTNRYTTSIPGLYAAFEETLARDLGWTLEGFREAFREVFAKGMAKADWKAGLVFIPKAIQYDPPQSPNVVKSWSDIWDEIPECLLKEEARQSLKAFTEGMSEAFRKAFEDTCRKAMPNPEPEPEPEPEEDPPVANAPGPALEPLKLEPPKQPSELPALLDAYCKSWVEAFQPSDGKPPKLQKADIRAASDLLKAHGLAEASSLIRRFLEDGDRFIAERGHVLRDIHQRVNGYRANKAPAKTASPGYRPRQPLASEVLAQKRKQWEGK